MPLVIAVAYQLIMNLQWIECDRNALKFGFYRPIQENEKISESSRIKGELFNLRTGMLHSFFMFGFFNRKE